MSRTSLRVINSVQWIFCTETCGFTAGLIFCHFPTIDSVLLVPAHLCFHIQLEFFSFKNSYVFLSRQSFSDYRPWANQSKYPSGIFFAHSTTPPSPHRSLDCSGKLTTSVYIPDNIILHLHFQPVSSCDLTHESDCYKLNPGIQFKVTE